MEPTGLVRGGALCHLRRRGRRELHHRRPALAALFPDHGRGPRHRRRAPQGRTLTPFAHRTFFRPNRTKGENRADSEGDDDGAICNFDDRGPGLRSRFGRLVDAARRLRAHRAHGNAGLTNWKLMVSTRPEPGGDETDAHHRRHRRASSRSRLRERRQIVMTGLVHNRPGHDDSV
jgi:hypothetical protein